MPLKDRFKRFQQRYCEIINAQLNNATHEKLQEFILSKAANEKPQNFNFYFDFKKEKLIFSITGGIHNGSASDILHYFRNYDDQATWHLSGKLSNVRTFELNLEKIDDKLLDDFEAYLNNRERQVAHISTLEESVKKIYIKPATVTSPDTNNHHNNNDDNKWSNASTIGKFAGLFAIGAVIVAYKLMQDPKAEQTNTFLSLLKK